MAGAGYKLFSTGDVLSASDVNLYLQQQTVMVFASAAARTTALSGVLAEGMVSYLKDTDVVEIYTGAAWVSLDDPNAIQNSLLTAKGSIVTATGASTPSALAVGTNGQTLVADSSTSTGLKWATPASGSTFCGVRCSRSAATSIPNATNTILLWDTEVFDTDTIHSTASNTSRFTVPSGKSGYWWYSARLLWPGSATGTRQVVILKNGSAGDITNTWGLTGTYDTKVFNGAISLTAGDYIEIRVYQTSGGALDLQGNNNDPQVSAIDFYYLGA